MIICDPILLERFLVLLQLRVINCTHSTEGCKLVFQELHGHLSGLWIRRGVLAQVFFILVAFFREKADFLMGSLETRLKDVV